MSGASQAPTVGASGISHHQCCARQCVSSETLHPSTSALDVLGVNILRGRSLPCLLVTWLYYFFHRLHRILRCLLEGCFGMNVHPLCLLAAFPPGRREEVWASRPFRCFVHRSAELREHRLHPAPSDVCRPRDTAARERPLAVLLHPFSFTGVPVNPAC